MNPNLFDKQADQVEFIPTPSSAKSQSLGAVDHYPSAGARRAGHEK